MKKALIIGGIVVVIIVGAVLAKTLFLTSGSVSTHTVVLTSDGFSPKEITLKKGDVVTFKTKAGEPFWPASDIHPTHGIYPEFDPKEQIPASKTWSFKFDRVGRWSYHDHLEPYLTGKIIVQ